MKALILAAGRGTRLKALTASRPKCLVQVNGRSIIDYQLEALLSAGVEQVTIVAGFSGDTLTSYVRRRYGSDPRISFIMNKEFAVTNNMFSLLLAEEELRGSDMLLMNADVVFDASIITDLMACDANAVAVEAGSFSEEAMKVRLREDGLSITSIQKSLRTEETFGCSIDLYRFSKEGVDQLLNKAASIIREEHRLNEWTEVAIDQLVSGGHMDVRAIDIGNRYWYEIDNMDDLRQAELEMGRRTDWRNFKVAFVDMDGTLFKGEALIPGAGRFVQELRERVPLVYFVSNNSSRSPDQYGAKLRAMGIPLADDDIILSSHALCAYLKRNRLSRVYLVGTEALEKMLAEQGIVHVEESPQAVVLGYDTELTYHKLCEASLFLRDPNLPYLATHADRVCPTERGSIPDIGSFIALFETATGRTPEVIFGKPDSNLVSHILEEQGISGDACLCVGDRLYTDYELARNLGALFVGVLTGDLSRPDIEGCQNFCVFPSVGDIFV